MKENFDDFCAKVLHRLAGSDNPDDWIFSFACRLSERRWLSSLQSLIMLGVEVPARLNASEKEALNHSNIGRHNHLAWLAIQKAGCRKQLRETLLREMRKAPTIYEAGHGYRLATPEEMSQEDQIVVGVVYLAHGKRLLDFLSEDPKLDWGFKVEGA